MPKRERAATASRSDNHLQSARLRDEDQPHRRWTGCRAVVDWLLRPVRGSPQHHRHGVGSRIKQDEDTTARHTTGLGDRRWRHEHQRQLRPSGRPRRRHQGSPRSASTRRHVLRYRRSLRSLHERGARRRSARARSRQGPDRDEVRLRHRRRHWRSEQPPGAHQGSRRWLAQAPPYRPHRSAVPASGRSERSDRGRRRRGQGADRSGQGAALRPF